MAGFLLSSVFLGIFVHPNASVSISEKSPSWVGAWWLGFALGSVFAFIIGILLTGLPRKFRRDDGNHKKETSDHKVGWNFTFNAVCYLGGLEGSVPPFEVLN